MKKVLLLMLTGFIAVMACAQATSSVSQTVTLTLKDAINISITSATGTSFLFDDVSKYENGLNNLYATTLKISSNRSWYGTVKTATANFSGPANAPAMPASVLGIRQSGTNTMFGSLSTTGLTYGIGDRGSNSFSADYTVNPGFDYDAGTYTISVVFTVTQL